MHAIRPCGMLAVIVPHIDFSVKFWRLRSVALLESMLEPAYAEPPSLDDGFESRNLQKPSGEDNERA